MAKATKGELAKLGRQIKIARKRRDLSQVEAAELADVTPLAWRNWERGRAQPLFITMEKVCHNVLDITVPELRAINPREDGEAS